VNDLLRNVPAAEFQLIERENEAPGTTEPPASLRYVTLHDKVTFSPRIGGRVMTPHVGFSCETPK